MVIMINELDDMIWSLDDDLWSDLTSNWEISLYTFQEDLALNQFSYESIINNTYHDR